MQLGTLVTFTCGFFIGVALRTMYEISFETTVLSLFIAFGLFFLGRQKSETFLAPLVFITSLLLFSVSLGTIRTEIASWQFNRSSLEQSIDEKILVQGVVVHEPDYRLQTVQLYVETDTDLLLVTTDRSQSFAYGDLVLVEGKLERPASFTTDLGRTFNYSGYLLAKGVEYKISFAKVELLSVNNANSVIGWLLYVKNTFITSMQKVIPEPEVGLASGLLLGVKSALGDEIESNFRRTGLIHIIVLSGYNVMLVVAFIMFFLSFLLPLRWRTVAGIVAIITFALIVGLSATVVRASIMASMVLLVEVLGRRYSVLRALLMAGFLMILINPYLLLYDIGFQLSFMATIGLVLIVPQFESSYITKKDWLGVKSFFLATLATQIAVLPLLLYHIGEVSIIALLINVLILPIVPVAMLLSFITGLIAVVSTFTASLIGYIAYLSLSYILFVAEWGSKLPFAAIQVPQFTISMIVLMYGVMVGIWYFLKSKKYSNYEMSDWTIEIETENVDSRTENSSDIPAFFR